MSAAATNVLVGYLCGFSLMLTYMLREQVRTAAKIEIPESAHMRAGIAFAMVMVSLGGAIVWPITACVLLWVHFTWKKDGG